MLDKYNIPYASKRPSRKPRRSQTLKPITTKKIRHQSGAKSIKSYISIPNKKMESLKGINEEEDD
jgi:hypothetical protein